MTANAVLEVNRARCGETRLVESELEPLGPGQVRLRVDRFAVTANNITYAVLGDMLGYWDFFPTGDPAWGRVPAMGWADVIESTHPDVATGGRYYGWFPMARFVDLTVSATADGLRDDGDHRQAHAPVYRSYVETAHDPMYPSGASGDDARRRRGPPRAAEGPVPHRLPRRHLLRRRRLPRSPRRHRPLGLGQDRCRLRAVRSRARP